MLKQKLIVSDIWSERVKTVFEELERLPGLLSKSLLTTTLSRTLTSRVCLPVIVGLTVTSSSSVLPAFNFVSHSISLPDPKKLKIFHVSFLNGCN